MPIPRAVATSKPKRETWMIEELYDTLIGNGLEAKIVKTRYPGVVLVYTSLEPEKLAKIVYSNYHAFMKRFTPAMSLLNPSKSVNNLTRRFLAELQSHLDNIISLGAKNTGVNLIVSIRGDIKYHINRQLIENIILDHNMPINRRSNIMLVVESVDSIAFIASGITRYCGPGCITVSL